MMELYLCINKDCLVNTFFGDKGFYSLDCPLCKCNDIIPIVQMRKLMAAAPDLLAALENLHGACEYWEDQNDPVLAEARRAIAKAKGGK